MSTKYVVTLTAEERATLEAMIGHGKRAARTLAHARILLKADASADGPGWEDGAISAAVEVSAATVQRVRKRFVEQGVQVALRPRLDRSTRRIRPPVLDGVAEAHLVTLACSTPPEGAGRWTLRLLAEHMVELAYVPQVSHETVRQVLKKNDVQPWLKEEWCLPPHASGEFVCAMEDVLDLYQQPYDPASPQVCMDELSKQLIGETRVPVPPAPGQVARMDYEYERLGVANLFIFFEPLAGWRRLIVTARRTRVDWAVAIRELVDVHYPQARKIRLVLDNLNTHVGGSLYEAFPPAEARRLLDRLEIHYTPKHGSWLNMAESELSILARQCLDRRIADPVTLQREVTAWERRRNRAQATMEWRFTTADARIKLLHLYPRLTEPEEEATTPRPSDQAQVA